jgi:hypothetical protein
VKKSVMLKSREMHYVAKHIESHKRLLHLVKAINSSSVLHCCYYTQ